MTPGSRSSASACRATTSTRGSRRATPRAPTPTGADSSRSSTWGRSIAPQRLEIELVLTLAGGGEARAPAGSVDAQPELPPPADAPPPEFPDRPGPRVAICMATYEPPEDLLRIQLESIKQQTHENWICLISDDRSSDEAFERAVALTEDDPRFVVSRSESRLGFYRNFERALSMAPAERRLRDPLRPGRPLAPREARTAARGHRRRAARLQRRPDRQPRRASSSGPPTGPSDGTTTRTTRRCCSPTP